MQEEANGDPSGFYKKIGFVEADEMVKHSELGKRIQKTGEISLQLRLYKAYKPEQNKQYSLK